MAVKKKNTTKKSPGPPRPPKPRPAPANGTALAPALAPTAPQTHIDIALGIENLVAIGVVHVENTLDPKLARQVGEVNRLGAEIAARNAELQAIYNDTPVDPALEAKCRAFIAAADELGLKLSYELTKSNFSPDSLRYNVGIRFRGDLHLSRDYQVEDERADTLQDEVAILRREQADAARAAAQTKAQLNPEWLKKQLRAAIALNAMNQTDTGRSTVEALIESIDRAIKLSTGLRQLGVDSD